MNLDRAFFELRAGAALGEQDFPGADRARGLTELLERSLQAYKRGDEVAGAHLLLDFQDRVYESGTAR